ncbi:hypothetical protein LWM68_08100 [Niabella sp. W65]|nr:hypothetical protein [Niabella sp. W65]MCH7362728.1 hypothetical protein [Niabella sp. W65]ULT38682.1 hypothetical protein KRR40_26765 [Niabella sp. I65]
MKTNDEARPKILSHNATMLRSGTKISTNHYYSTMRFKKAGQNIMENGTERDKLFSNILNQKNENTKIIAFYGSVGWNSKLL